MANPFQLQLSNASAAKGVSKALDYVLPILMHKQKLQHAKSLVSMKLRQDEDKLAQEALEAKDKLRLNTIQTRVKMMAEEAQAAAKGQDQAGYSRARTTQQGLMDKVTAETGAPPIDLGGVNVAPMEEAQEIYHRLPKIAAEAYKPTTREGMFADIESKERLKAKYAKPGAYKATTRPEMLADIEAKEKLKAKYENKKTSEYTPQQMVDDTRGFYSTAIRVLLDPDGFVKEGFEEEYNRLFQDMRNDMQLIGQNKRPKWLTGEKIIPPSKSARTKARYIYKDGKLVPK